MKVLIVAASIAMMMSMVLSPVRAGSPNSFQGAYVGLNAGVAWGSSGYATDPGCRPNGFATFCDPGSIPNGSAVASSGTGRLSSAGFVGGVQAGYNRQLGNMVFGAEGDFGAFDLRKSVSTNGSFPVTFLGNSYSLREGMSTDWLATLRGRAGILVAPQVLLYGTAGLALTDFKSSSSYADNAIGIGFPGGAGNGGGPGLRLGWTVGGGGEWLLQGGWSVKAEYLYLDFGSESFDVVTTNSSAYTQTMRIGADLKASLARVGVNYRY